MVYELIRFTYNISFIFLNSGLSRSGKKLKKTITFIICFLLISSFAQAQENIPELELEEYQIVGKDTRVFSITGDKISTVKFIPLALTLPEEKRTRVASEGIIDESERIRREEAFYVTRGINSGLEYTLGTHNTNNLFGKVSFDSGKTGVSLHLINRLAEENTLNNMAPLSQEFEAVGYYQASFADIAMDFGLLNGDDDGLSSNFRPGNQEINLYRMGITLNSLKYKNWNIKGMFSFKGGTFKNFVIDDKIDDRDESVFDGGISASGKIYDISLIINTSGEYIELGDSNGSLFSTGIMGEWLFMNALGIKAGADFHAFAMPDEDTKKKVYPVLNMDLALTSHAFVKLNYKPGVKTYSFRDIYDDNGLVTINTPMLFEERDVDFDGEIGIRFHQNLTASAGGFVIETKRPPVYTRSGDFFDVVNDAEINISGYSLKSRYNKNNIVELEGIFKINNASWNFTGEVPYIPDIEARLGGYMIPRKFWKIRASMQFYGEHYVEKYSKDVINSDEVEDSFLTIDIGVDRELWKKYISMYMDLRNITNSKGSWWTDKYKIPGIGIYLGVRAHY
ncbi:MAG TPA: hypothetical protein ENH82_11670 [bacterium]|nr:hypothetical protein [bacterium]